MIHSALVRRPRKGLVRGSRFAAFLTARSVHSLSPISGASLRMQRSFIGHQISRRVKNGHE